MSNLSHRPMSVRLADPESIICPFCFNDRRDPRPTVDQTFYTTWQGFEIVSTGPFEWCAIRCCHCRAQGPSAGNQIRAIDAWRDHYVYSLDLLIGYCQARDYGVNLDFDPDGVFKITITMIWAAPFGVLHRNTAITKHGRMLRSVVWDCWEALAEYHKTRPDPLAQEVAAARQDAQEAAMRGKEGE